MNNELSTDSKFMWKLVDKNFIQNGVSKLVTEVRSTINNVGMLIRNVNDNLDCT
jgi:hypothetical protein